MRNLWMSWLLLCAGVLAALSGAACAQSATPGAGSGAMSGAEIEVIQRVIRGQLEAFAADDADKAYSFASPGIRGLFRSPQVFMDMVRQGYPVVYRPASVVFLKPEKDGDEVLQPVQMSDASGQVWIALYTMQRQAGGAWLTNGCQLLRSGGRVT